jgi:hypothetical protein
MIPTERIVRKKRALTQTLNPNGRPEGKAGGVNLSQESRRLQPFAKPLRVNLSRKSRKIQKRGAASGDAAPSRGEAAVLQLRTKRER